MKFKTLLTVSALATCALAAVSSNVRAQLNYDNDVPPDLRQQLEQDIGTVKSLQGDSVSANYKQIFNSDKLDGESLMSFFEARIRGFGMDACGGGPSVAACVQPFMDSHKMWITPNYIRFNAPQIYRLSVVFHESRHTEDAHGNYPHATCPTPYRDENGNDIKGILSGTLMAGHPACDTTILGAYGLQATLLKNIELFCTTCTEKLKQDAQLFGDDTILRISNLPQRQKLRKDLSGTAAEF
jgi:hypothetical protein